MRYPKLVRKQDCKIPISITLYNDDIGEDGEPLIDGSIDTFCNYQNSSKRVLTNEDHQIEISGIALFSEDIFPNIENISSGEAIIFGESRQIAKGIKARNPDGSVNYIRLELM
jgi:hypothetical protein